jgi:hypothetical protein
MIFSRIGADITRNTSAASSKTWSGSVTAAWAVWMDRFAILSLFSPPVIEILVSSLPI